MKATDGKSIVASAAYRHRAKMKDQSVNQSWNYERKDGLVHAEVVGPQTDRAWVNEILADGITNPNGASEKLWNRVTTDERQENGQLAKEIVIALPIELYRDENIALVRQFVAEQFVAKGFIVDWVYHDSPGNPHIHLMHTMRPIGEAGFGNKKIPVLNVAGEVVRQKGKIVYENFSGYKHELRELRAAWGELANHHLELAGSTARIDMRSYKERGIDLEPSVHLGPAGAAVARKEGMSAAREALAQERQNAGNAISLNPELVLQKLATERSTFGERDIAKVIFRLTDDPLVLSNTLARVLESDRLVTLRPEVVDPETNRIIADPVYSTREMVLIEQNTAALATSLALKAGYEVRSDRLLAAVEQVEGEGANKRFSLSEEQRTAIEHLTDEKRIGALVGVAGAGKSTVLEVVRLAYEAEGHTVYGAALAGQAARNLEMSSGIASRTIASLEIAWGNGTAELKRGDVLVIDEAGMISSRQMDRVITKVSEAGAKLLVVGGYDQLQPIEAGAPFRAIVERVGYAELTEVRRQSVEWMKLATNKLQKAQVADALDDYRDNNRITHTASMVEARQAIVVDYLERRSELQAAFVNGIRSSFTGGELLILAHRNVDVRDMNDRVRSVLLDKGEVKEGVSIDTFKSDQSFNGERNFGVGDRIVFLKNAKFEEETRPDLGRQRVENGSLGVVSKIENTQGEPVFTIQMDTGKTVVFRPSTYNNIDHGYAITIHKSQGTTVEHSFVLATRTLDRQLAYVALSRHKTDTGLYAAREEFMVPGQFIGKDVESVTHKAMSKALSRDGSKSSTLDYAQEEFAQRRGIETLRTLAPAFMAFVDRQRDWIKEQTEKLSVFRERPRGLKPVNEQSVEATVEQGRAQGEGRMAQAAAIKPDEQAQVAQVKIAQVKLDEHLIAGITKHAESVEAVAYRQANMNKEYEKELKLLRKDVEKIWVDSEAAMKKIIQAIEHGYDARITMSNIQTQPERWGTLRGSDRILDRFNEKGAERKTALLTIKNIGNTLVDPVHTFSNQLRVQTEAENARRNRMSHNVPHLSDQAIEAVRYINSINQDQTALKEAVKTIDKGIVQELDAFSKYLTNRFGNLADRMKVDDPQVWRHLSAEQRKEFPKLIEDIKQAMDAHKIVAAEMGRQNTRTREIKRDRGMGISY